MSLSFLKITQLV